MTSCECYGLLPPSRLHTLLTLAWNASCMSCPAPLRCKAMGDACLHLFSTLLCVLVICAAA